MKSPSQIEQRISHLKERENDVDVSFDIEILELQLNNSSILNDFEDFVWKTIAFLSGHGDRSRSVIEEIRILLWILED